MSSKAPRASARGALAASNSPLASDAALAALDAGGSSVDAVIAGYFALAGEEAFGLCAPAVALVSGPGAGARAFDGRALQPGRGAPRPRGFVNEEDVPRAALAAAPRTVQLAALLHAHHGRVPLRDLARHGETRALAAGAHARAALIRRVGETGPIALTASAVVRACLAEASSAEGGALTEDDMTAGLPTSEPARELGTPDSRAVVTPGGWPSSDAPCIVLLAIDARGLASALALDARDDGLDVPSFEIRLAARAFPVRRGVRRVTPGSPLTSPSPIALASGQGGVVVALGLGSSSAIEAFDFVALFSGGAMASVLAERAPAIAVVKGPRLTTVITA